MTQVGYGDRICLGQQSAGRDRCEKVGSYQPHYPRVLQPQRHVYLDVAHRQQRGQRGLLDRHVGIAHRAAQAHRRGRQRGADAAAHAHHCGHPLGQDAHQPHEAGCGVLWQNGGEVAAGSATAGLAATTARPTGRAARPAT